MFAEDVIADMRLNQNMQWHFSFYIHQCSDNIVKETTQIYIRNEGSGAFQKIRIPVIFCI